MATERFKDNVGRPLGRIDDIGKNRIARDEVGKVLGRYDKDTGRTRDVVGRVITNSGDALGGLILNRKKPR
jgi:hypothetical protein